MTHHDERDFQLLSDLFTEDLDNLASPHEFSVNYHIRKAELLREYRDYYESETQIVGVSVDSGALQKHAKADQKTIRFPRWKAAAVALVAALAVMPVVCYGVANNSDFFANAFGTAARESIQTHDVDMSDGVEITTFTYPTREYVDVDVEEAERLLGDYLSTTPVEIMVGDNKITVLSTVRDKNTLVVHFTMSREGGVTALEWSALTNEGRGAQIPDDFPFYWILTSLSDSDETAEDPNYFGSMILVNKNKTTSDSFDCYMYAASFDPLADDETIELQVSTREDDSVIDSVALPITTPLPTSDFASAEGDTVTVSPLSLQIGGELGKKLGADPYFNHFAITLSDGTCYTVFDRTKNLDNTSYILGRDSDAIAIFNRMVNPESIECIVIDGIEFMGA